MVAAISEGDEDFSAFVPGDSAFEFDRGNVAEVVDEGGHEAGAGEEVICFFF
jgi:hypothetical protein